MSTRRTSRTTTPESAATALPSSASADFLVAAAEHVRQQYPSLYNHQCSGVAFLLSRRKAILADDMGLGKTRTAIVAAREQSPDGPFLVVCPATLKLNWEREIHMVEPGADVQVLAKESPRADARWTIVNYDRLGKFASELADLPFAVVVLDEAHYIKNRSARTKHAMTLLAGDREPDGVYLLTGTPMTNRPRDLFQLLKAIGHPASRSFYKFARRYCGAYDNGFGLDSNGASNLDELSMVVAGVMLRRAKSEALDLPEKVRSWVPVDVPVQRIKGYETRALDYLTANPAREGSTWFTFLGLINKARHELALVKARATADFVTDLVESGQKVVVFSGYTGVVDTMLERFGDQAVSLTGSTSTTQRQAVVDRFQTDDSVRVFVGNIQAAGVGITLTAGTHVVFNDLDWVPANHWQAEDRIHRIGQTATAFVTYIYAPDTLDSFVAAMLEAKAEMVATVESASVTHSTMLDDVVDLALSGEKAPLLVGSSRQTAEPTTPTMGLQRTMLQLLEQFGTEIESGVAEYRFASSSNPKVRYTATLDNGTATCTCPGFEYGSTCWHVKSVLRGDFSKALPAP
ncbi:MAG: SNF2-related protein [Ilumatobacteraceae bacterium]